MVIGLLEWPFQSRIATDDAARGHLTRKLLFPRLAQSCAEGFSKEGRKMKTYKFDALSQLKPNAGRNK